MRNVCASIGVDSKKKNKHKTSRWWQSQRIMASIVLRIDERVVKNGMSPVRIRISHRHTAAWYQTGVLLEPSCFCADSIYEPVSKRAYMAAEKRARLTAIVRKWDDGMFELERSEGGDEQIAKMNATALRDYIFGTRDKKPTAVQLVAKMKKTPQTGDFMAFFDQYGQSKDKERTRENYAYVWRLLSAYMQARHLNDLFFSDINCERLVEIGRAHV